MEMGKALEVKMLVEEISNLRNFRSEMRSSIHRLGEETKSTNVHYIDEIKQSVDEVSFVKYKTYQFAMTQIDNRRKELEERLANL